VPQKQNRVKEIIVAQKIKTRVGRPKLPKGEAKDMLLRARVSKGEFATVEGAAQRAGKELSDWIRETLIGAAAIES
jgi:hypothetical protein